MSAPLYFLAGETASTLFPGELINRSVLARHGLADVFRDCSDERGVDWASAEITGGYGPNKLPGMIVSALPVASRNAPRSLSYKANDPSWRWIEIVPGVTWLGLDTMSPPKPEDLARRRQQDGHWVTLCDGQAWLVPAIRRPESGDKTIVDEQQESRTFRGYLAGTCLLGMNLRYETMAGVRRIVRTVKACDQRLWDWSARYYNVVYSNPEEGEPVDSPDDVDAFEYCHAALEMNYRVGIAEMNELQLLDNEYWRVIEATLDVPWLMRRFEAMKDLQKKTTPASDNG